VACAPFLLCLVFAIEELPDEEEVIKEGLDGTQLENEAIEFASDPL
jgi:hypothetical protein